MERMDILGPLAIVGALLLAYSFLMALVTIGLTGHLAAKADKHLSILTTAKDPLFNSLYPGGGRLSWYGFQIVLRKMGLTRRWPLTGRPGRVEAIDAAPRWLKHVLVWIYFGFFASGLSACVLSGMTILIEKYFF